jgi:hypothetical protein
MDIAIGTESVNKDAGHAPSAMINGVAHA